MRRFFILLASVAVIASASAEGYQVNSLSAKQLGMGHVGTGMKLNSESIFFNPAATAFQSSKFDISAGVTGIAANAYYTPLGDNVVASESDNPLSTPLYIYFNYKPTKDLAIGVGLNTPYGSSMNWGNDWVGAHLVQEINLQSFSLQPTISYKFWDKLSVGVGLSIAWGSFDLSRSLFPVGGATNGAIAALLAGQGQANAAGVIAAVGDNALASAKLQGDAQVAWGVNLGVMYDINEKWTLGLSYRSKTQMLVNEGSTELSYFSDPVKGILAKMNMIPAMDKESFTASLPAPANVTFGASFRPTDRWEVALDLQWVGWGVYENLNVVFTQPEPILGVSPTPVIDPINSIKNYKNSMVYRVGAQYHASKCVTARVGAYLDESPVDSKYLNPETPSMTKLGFTTGLTIRPTRFMSIDLAYGYVMGANSSRIGETSYENPLIYGRVYGAAIAEGASEAAAAALATKAASQPFKGSYSVSANMFSVGLSFNF